MSHFFSLDANQVADSIGADQPRSGVGWLPGARAPGADRRNDRVSRVAATEQAMLRIRRRYAACCLDVSRFLGLPSQATFRRCYAADGMQTH